MDELNINVFNFELNKTKFRRKLKLKRERERWKKRVNQRIWKTNEQQNQSLIKQLNKIKCNVNNKYVTFLFSFF